MKTDKKVTEIPQNDTLSIDNIIENSRETLLAAKDWFLDDTSLLAAYWHERMGYMEAWVAANWHLVLEQGQEALHELDEWEDLALLWLVDHVNNNPVPLKECYVAGNQVPAGQYTCMACSTKKVLSTEAELSACDACHYGIFSAHKEHKM
ncbi:hypothetical protein CBF23_005915 [Marinomonas agarivorans]|nr:hypothetical protein CBF23_005915 [Marinomonas agarivorans]